MSRPHLTIAETLALSAGIANEGGLSDAQVERISRWAHGTRKENATLDAVLLGDLEVIIPESESEELKFKVTARGRAKLTTNPFTAIFTVGKKAEKTEAERANVANVANATPPPAPRFDSTKFLRDFLDSLFGPQTIEKVDNNKKDGGR